jgi:hypothetical protein
MKIKVIKETITKGRQDTNDSNYEPQIYRICRTINEENSLIKHTKRQGKIKRFLCWNTTLLSHTGLKPQLRAFLTLGLHAKGWLPLGSGNFSPE